MKRMKKSELRKAITDGTDVAVVTAYKPQGEFAVHGQRATVIAVDQPRRVHTGVRLDIGGHIVTDGVRVRYDDGDERVVAPHDVICSWAEYVTERVAVIVARTKNADALADLERQAITAAQALGGRAETIRDRKTFKTIDYRIVLTVEQAANIARAMT